MSKMRIIEFMQANGLYVVIGLAFIMALSVSGYWVAKPAGSKTSKLGTVFSVIAFLGVCGMVVNLKIGFLVACLGYLAKSIVLLRNGYGVGSFIRPILYFKRFDESSIPEEEELVDLF